MPAGATNHVLTALVASFDYDPSAMLTCLVPLPLKSNLRHCALVYLQSAVKVTDLASYLKPCCFVFNGCHEICR